MLVKFTSVSFRNFFSYGNNLTTINLDTPGTTLIVGNNLDETSEGSTTNGTGKSTILQAILYAAYDKCLLGITKNALINVSNGKQMEVFLTFEVGADVYQIHRYRKLTSATDNGCTITKNNIDITPANAADYDISTIIGLSFDEFTRLVIMTSSTPSFLNLPATSTSSMSQRYFIENLLGLDELSTKSSTLKDRITSAKKAHSLLVNTHQERERQKSELQSRIDVTKQRILEWDTTREAKIAELASKRQTLGDVDFDTEYQLHEELNMCIQEKTQIQGKLSLLSTTVGTQQKKLDGYKTELVQLRESKCPRCGQHYSAAQSEVADIEKEILSLSKQIDESRAEITSLTKLVQNIDDATTALRKQTSFPTTTAVNAAVKTYSGIDDTIDSIITTPNPHAVVLDELLAMVGNVDDPELVTTMVDLERELTHKNFLFKMLTSNDSVVRKTLVRSYVNIMNERLTHYLSALKLPHQIRFQEDLSLTIQYRGKPMHFGNLSTGQKNRIDFALSMMFKDMRERIHGRVNICLFDEVFDSGLDSVGVHGCAALIKQSAITSGCSYFIISHRSEIECSFDRKLTVTMSSGFSSVSTDA